MFDQSRQSFFAAKKANEYKQSLANSRHSKNIKKKKTDPEKLKYKLSLVGAFPLPPPLLPNARGEP